MKWGIIGSGHVAYEIAYAIKSVSNNIIVAVSSRTQANADEFGKILNIPGVYNKYQQLIDDPEVEIVYIAVPNTHHAQIMKECLEKGKHVLCEKPFTINAKEALEIKELANKRGVFCMEAFWTRFHPSVEKVRKLISDKEIGAVKMIRGSFGHNTTSKRAHDLSAGGGALLDLGFYPISLAYTFLGRPDKITGNLAMGKSGVDVQAVVNLKYPDAGLVTIMCSHETNLDNEFIIFGERGSIKIRAPFYRSSTIEVISYPLPQAVEGERKILVPRNYFILPVFGRYAPFVIDQIRRFLPSKSKKIVSPFEGNGYKEQILHVYDCIRNGKTESPLHSLDTTIGVLRILDEVRANEKFIYPSEITL